ncbi:MAG: hypothetical protein Q4C53_02255 [Clostridia bacterium]|nr:hypothetical protein [Clostridia bacterium]
MARFEKDDGKSRRAGSAETRLHSISDKDTKKKKPTDNVTDENDEVIPVPLHIQNRREMNTGERVGILVCTFVLAGMILFVLTGYERITRAYAAINELSQSIDDVNLRISELNVAIECAVTIEQAENAALAAGMTYPTEAQIFNDYRFPGGSIAPSQPQVFSSDDSVTANVPAGTPSGADPTAPSAEPGGEDIPTEE